MQVTLKKARKLMSELKIIANNAKSTENLSFSAYRSFDENQIDEQISVKKAELGENLTKSVQLVRWIYEIRSSVAEANKRSGIDKIMTDLKLTEELIAKYSQIETLSNRSATTSSDILAKKLANAKKRLDSEAGDPYGRAEDSVSVTVFADVSDELKTLKKQKVDLEDRLTALNSAKKIELSDELSKFVADEAIS